VVSTGNHAACASTSTSVNLKRYCRHQTHHHHLDAIHDAISTTLIGHVSESHYLIADPSPIKKLNHFVKMPAGVGSSLEQVQQSLAQCLQRKDAAGAQTQLQKAKLILLQQNALVPNSDASASLLKTARSVLEVGALLSIRTKDPESFVRYYSQLQPFYEYPGLQSASSSKRSQITGLYLLLLLSQGDYAGFHTLLESLIVSEGVSGDKSVEDDPYIKYPVDLERSLMEGSYDQVWRKTSGRDVPGEEFALFSEVLTTQTIDNMVSC